MPDLITKTEYDKLTPIQQGYVVYMQSEWPGSELKEFSNPYPDGSKEYDEWRDGEFRGVLAAQDSEE